MTADEALDRLTRGNARFLQGEARFPTVQKAVLTELAKGQTPFATILGCADSRVPPELLFDAGFGELSIVLGHDECGAVKAALATQKHGRRERARIQHLADLIAADLPEPDPASAPEAQLARAVEANVRAAMAQALESAERQARIAEGHVKLVGAICEIATGRVRFLD